MPRAKGYDYLIDGLPLPSYPKHDKPQVVDFKSITKVTHDALLCQRDAVDIVDSDSDTQYTQCQLLSGKFSFFLRIQILPYSSQGHSSIKMCHYDIEEKIDDPLND